jgi:DNA-binding CsgD family transcriptional regulator/PAS domain-containing protein
VHHTESSLIADRLYDAALDVAAWPAALQALAESFNAHGVVVMDLSQARPVVEESPGLSLMSAAYNRDGWYRIDTLAAEGHRKGLTTKPGIYSDHEFVGAQRRSRDVYYQEFLRPWGIEGALCLLAEPFAGTYLVSSFQRRIGAGPVSPREREQFSRMARHYSRASAVRMRLRQTEAMSRGLADQLSAFDCAAAVVDRNGRMLMCNAAFEALRSHGVGRRGGHIGLGRHDQQERLDRLVGNVLNGGTGTKGPDTLALERPNSFLPLLVRVIPLRPSTAERLIGSLAVEGALLTIIDPEHAAYPDLAKVLGLLGLTKAQARVATLVAAGHTAKSSAEALGLSDETVRTTLKSVYAKLGLARQSELARLVARTAPINR